MALLQVDNLEMHFPVRGGILNRVVSHVHALNGVSFEVERGEILGVVGESGCGKSTLGKCLVRLHEPTGGEFFYDGSEYSSTDHKGLMHYRSRVQMIFQDPYSSLNPRLTIRDCLREVIDFHQTAFKEEDGLRFSQDVDELIHELVEKVGLRPDAIDKYPHEFSGGQRQRIGIARALACKPEFLIADEPVSALDVSIQAQVLNLLMDLKDEFGLTLIFISHDLKVIEHFCDRVLVMYLGSVVEEVPCEDLHEVAQHPYTRALLGANPVNHPAEERVLTVLEGDVPSPFDLPTGCAFAGRCPIAEARCHTERPVLEKKASGHRSACFLVD